MGLLGAIGGFAGSMLGGGDRDEALRYLEEARKAYEGLDRYADIAPAQEGQSNYLAADPATRAAQMDALTEFQNQYRQGGLNAIDRAKLADIENQTAQTANTTQARVMDDAARRGMATSGNTLVAQQVAGQQAAQRGASNELQVAAQAEQGRMA